MGDDARASPVRPCIDLRSDTVTKPTPEMLAAAAAAEVDDDVQGFDPTTRALEEHVLDLPPLHRVRPKAVQQPVGPKAVQQPTGGPKAAQQPTGPKAVSFTRRVLRGMFDTNHTVNGSTNIYLLLHLLALILIQHIF